LFLVLEVRLGARFARRRPHGRLFASIARGSHIHNRLDLVSLAMLTARASQLLEDGPALPVYHYSTNELVKPYVRGLYPTALDVHPLNTVWIDRDWRKAPQPQALRP